MIKSNERIVIKRDNHIGIIPTIPTYEDHTNRSTPWTDYDIYIGEFFMNTKDDKLWWRSENGINLIYSSGQTTEFVDLSDCPHSYIGKEGQYLKVNSSATGIDFYSISSVTSSIQLSDMPHSYKSYANYFIKVNSSGTAYELSTLPTTFLGLTDTPSAYTANYALFCNSEGTGINYQNMSNVLYTNTLQTITSEKSFNANIYINSGFTMSSLLINSIYNDTGFTLTPSNNSIPTSLAVYDYINQIVLSGVTLTNVPYTNQINTFDSVNVFEKDIEVDGSIFIGPNDIDGSFKLSINNNGALQISKRILGSWTTCNTFDVV